MANYTEHYQLHQWEPGDAFLRTDFNEDLEKIDSQIFSTADALNHISLEMPRVAVGTYQGNSAEKDGIMVSLPFKPKIVLVWGNYFGTSSSRLDRYNGMAVEGIPLDNGILTLSDNGFIVKSTTSGGYQAYPDLNADLTYFYLAVG